MRWHIHQETEAWGNSWLSVRRLDVEQPDGERIDGIIDSAHHVFRATTAVRIGEPTERNESDRIEWIPLTDVPAMIRRREIVSGITLVGLQQALLEALI